MTSRNRLKFSTITFIQILTITLNSCCYFLFFSQISLGQETEQSDDKSLTGLHRKRIDSEVSWIKTYFVPRFSENRIPTTCGKSAPRDYTTCFMKEMNSIIGNHVITEVGIIELIRAGTSVAILAKSKAHTSTDKLVVELDLVDLVLTGKDRILRLEQKLMSSSDSKEQTVELILLNMVREHTIITFSSTTSDRIKTLMDKISAHYSQMNSSEKVRFEELKARYIKQNQNYNDSMRTFKKQYDALRKKHLPELPVFSELLNQSK